VKVGPLLAHLHVLEEALAAELRRGSGAAIATTTTSTTSATTFAVTADKRGQALGPLEQRYEGKTRLVDRASEPASSDLLEDLRMPLPPLAGDRHYLGGWQRRRPRRCATRNCCRSQPIARRRLNCRRKWFTTRIKTGAPQALVVG